MFCHVLSCSVMSRHVHDSLARARGVMFCHVLSCSVTFCHVLSCPRTRGVMFCHVHDSIALALDWTKIQSASQEPVTHSRISRQRLIHETAGRFSKFSGMFGGRACQNFWLLLLQRGWCLWVLSETLATIESTAARIEVRRRNNPLARLSTKGRLLASYVADISERLACYYSTR